MKLWEIEQQIEDAIGSAVDRETGEIDPEQLETISGLEMDLRDKAVAVALYIQGEELEGKSVASVAKQLADRAKGHQRRADALREYLARILERKLGHDSISDPRIQIAWRKSAAVEVDDVAVLPTELTRTSVTADKKSIGDILKAGGEVRGCRRVERHSLQIKS